ncbi:hypothetical protein AYR62_11535 [Secundilactobacillus paracollinoides]|uniref:helix-turn-helix domain-containing protein n=1 Tax=Secundilactobacillus paracollinoides TaxID=240427 RepID=UPI0006D1B2E2|nr:helix-turn-helix transcriptional regulator [Secundilactobacillus paracollinoides]ANZ64643.1 hypothetical protein AYR62_11535 [Secundilactobacillus paracollinoides]
MQLGELIKINRMKKRLTQKQLASIMIFSRQTISRWENRDVNFKIATILALSGALSVDSWTFDVSEKESVYIEIHRMNHTDSDK